MSESILNSIKKPLGIMPDDSVFDPDLILHINSVLATLVQEGIGPKEGFTIKDSTATWDQFLGRNDPRYESIKSYACLKVRLMFDPPASATVLKSYEELIREFEWRNFVTAEVDAAKAGSSKESDKLKPISDFSFDVRFDKLDYAFGKKYIEEKFKPVIAGCSSVTNGHMVGRNFDYYYDWDLAIRVEVAATEQNYASHGMVNGYSELTKSNLEKGLISDDILKALPFLIVDGANEYGLFVSTHLVHLDVNKGKTIGSVPTHSVRDSICTCMLPRYVLDHYKTAAEAIADLQANVSFYGHKVLWDMGYEAHFFIADRYGNSYAIEFVNNHLVATNQNGLTNFYVDDVIFNDDGKVYTPETQDAEHDAIKTNHVTPFAMGLERWNLIKDNYNTCFTKYGMVCLLRDTLDYRKSYTNTVNKWYTEFVGENSKGILTAASSVSDYSYIMEASKKMYEERDRNVPLTWHTSHTCVYDLLNNVMYMYDPSEDKNKEYVFELKK